jgi:signal transduction histidine kinase
VRRRILQTSLGVTLTVIVLMAVTMVWADWINSEQNFQNQLDAEFRQVSEKLEHVTSEGKLSQGDLEDVLPSDRRLDVVTPDGKTLSAGTGTTSGPSVGGRVVGVGDVRLTDVSGRSARSHIVAIVTIVVIAVVLALLAVLLSLRTSRRLTEPIRELADHAQRLGAGDLRPSDRRYGIPELDRLADAMDASVSRIAALLAEERRLTLDASHQLKTPLTALSMRLEELAEHPDDSLVRAEATAAFEQVERLTSVVDGLLVDRRSPATVRPPTPLDIIIGQQMTEWAPAFAAVDRDLTSEVGDGASVLVDPGPVGQVVATLIENSLSHGAGRTTVAASAPQETLYVDVFDEGEGVDDTIAPYIFEREFSGAGGTGLGLSAAQDAAVSVGGRLALVQRRPAHFRFFLHGWEDPAAVSDEPEGRAERDSDDVRGDVVS